MKKLFLAAVFLLPLVAFAQGADAGHFVPLAPIPGLTDNQATPNLVDFLNNLYKLLIGFAAVIAVIQIVRGGLMIATQDSISSHGEGRALIMQSVLGLVLVLSPVLVFTIINPSILNFGRTCPDGSTSFLCMDALVTPTGGGGGHGGIGSAPPAPATGCTTGTSGPYFEIATCASNTDATNYTCKNGLAQTIPPGKKDASTNKCITEATTIYCGKKLTVTYYAYTHKPLGKYDPLSFILTADFSGKVAPNDAANEQAFGAACRTDGGTVSSERTWEGIGFQQQYLRNPLAWSNGCEKAGQVVVDPTKEYGASCYGVELSCQP